ncbi:MAG: exodeoxyribonuclease VII small subunit [Acidobacteria bacterium]|nr:exodeoxyribonuclease VII small subunit [Acidobacteriota bacterium]
MAKTDKPGEGAQGLTYARAIKELNTILGDLESDDVDVDVLAEKVARASELIEFCRQRISGAKMQIEEVVQRVGTADVVDADDDEEYDEDDDED